VWNFSTTGSRAFNSAALPNERFRIEKRPQHAGRIGYSQPPAPKAAEFQFERPDWALFRSVETLSQKAGVPTTLLRRLVLKELVDNALDAGGAHVRIGAIDEHGHPFAGRSADCNRFFIQDDGPGIPVESPVESVARLFSINRPLLSSKLWRLPARGALGNGLRVVAGAVAASDGALEVWTRNRHLVLYPQEDGSTSAEAFDADFPTGTRIEVVFGERLPHDPAPLQWAEAAIHMAGGSTSYSGKPSPWWYDGDHFFELLRAAGERPVRDLIASLDGCTGAKAGRIAAAFKNVPCNQLSRHEATGLPRQGETLFERVRPEFLRDQRAQGLARHHLERHDAVLSDNVGRQGARP
jgi:hypothetical protein